MILKCSLYHFSNSSWNNSGPSNVLVLLIINNPGEVRFWLYISIHLETVMKGEGKYKPLQMPQVGFSENGSCDEPLNY